MGVGVGRWGTVLRVSEEEREWFCTTVQHLQGSKAMCWSIKDSRKASSTLGTLYDTKDSIHQIQGYNRPTEVVRITSLATIIASRYEIHNWMRTCKMNSKRNHSKLLRILGHTLLGYEETATRGVNPGGWGSRPQILRRGVAGGRRGVVDGSWNIIISYIMYWKYVRKWWLLKRYRIICPEVAVNEQFLPGK